MGQDRHPGQQRRHHSRRIAGHDERTTLAGGLRTANAHFANILLAIYLATGQDAANIIEGSQGIVHAEMNNDDLYFSATLPNIIVGSIGNGKDLDFAKKNLSQLV